MADSQYPGNSNREKAQAAPPKKEVKSVVTTPGVQRKPPLGRRIRDQFTGDDAHSVGGYILFEVMIPAAKSMIADAASQGVERLLFGDSRPRSAPGSRAGYTPYGSFSRSSAPTNSTSTARVISDRGRAVHDFREILLATRGEAMEVLERLGDLVNQYEMATVADLYSLVGITGNFTDDTWGWTDLRSASVRAVREGYILEMPRPTPLN